METKKNITETKNIKRYWLGDMNRCLITNGKRPKGIDWQEVDAEIYKKEYQRIYKEACETIFHC